MEAQLLEQTKQRLVVICEKVNDQLKAGKSLKDINKWSYSQRELGEDMIYFSWSTKSDDPEVSCLVAAPVAKQKDYKKFLEIPAEGCNTLPKFTIYVYASGCQFIEKQGSERPFKKLNLI